MSLPSPTHTYLVTQALAALPKSRLTVVDYGCGAGALLQYLPSSKIKQYTGFDVNAAALAQARTEFSSPKYRFSHISAGRVPTLGARASTDLIILVGVWQYLTASERKQLLTKARLALRRGGVLAISCATNHWPYRVFNLYQFVIPHTYVDRAELLDGLKANDFSLLHAQEKGLLIAPLFSNILSFFIDGVDYLLWRQPGTLGRLGNWARQVVAPFIRAEFVLPIDYGYTLFALGKKA